jgi:hypothetical protein
MCRRNTSRKTAGSGLIGANLSFLRDAIVRIGGWRTDLGKVNNR